ncbi:PTS system mannose/fructose/N-acetylgalactosamine-transporter subunit IIB [Furfurilactobacillus entadae]|uniref:PTS system mannose/fructose/N-acetylgalactosamine-transporter subunit IIB n=1 Tax=Furfurilactobacillus entadae TaxID=2922307 RepID=UPI0035EA3B0C
MTMKIRLARIDSRLLHGQVATIWTRALRPQQILVVSDGAAGDALRKDLIIKAAPAGVTVSVITIQRLIDIYQDAHFDDLDALLLFETPADVQRAVVGGVTLTSVNVGSLSYTDGKTMITDAVAVSEEDATIFRELSGAGVKLEVQKTPTDQQLDLMALLTEHGL